MVVTNVAARSVDWAAAGTWVWIGTFAVEAVLGLAMAAVARKIPAGADA